MMLDRPLRFQPLFKRIRWGGRRLGTELGKLIGSETDYAESWELVDHGVDQSLVAEGPLKGIPLCQLLREAAPALLGAHEKLTHFPLLIKFLDARDRLSVQVHPNDEQAARSVPGERGKTEAWVILAAEPGGCVYAGLKPGVDRAALRQALESGTVESCLSRLEVRPGDSVFIPAGTVHAIGEGVLLAEVQQSSDLTFRLYDWNRLGTDGQPRPLHVEQSLECIDFDRGPVELCRPVCEQWAAVVREVLVESPYFTIRRYRGSGRIELPAKNRCGVCIVLEGTVELSNAAGTMSFCKGETTLIPAAAYPIAFDLPPGAVVLETFW